MNALAESRPRSTHNLGQVKRRATRVVHLGAGRLIVERPVDDFFSGVLPVDAEPVPAQRTALVKP